MGKLQLRMHGTLLIQVQEFKYLGVWVDASLSWERQIRESCADCMTRIRAIRRLYASYWGLHPQVVERLIKAIVFPRLFYGVSAWGGCGPIHETTPPYRPYLAPVSSGDARPP